MKPLEQTTTDTIKLLLYRDQFKKPELFDDLLLAMGKNPNDKAIVITINQ